MNGSQPADCRHLATDRFARFKDTPEVLAVLSRHDGWARTQDGITAMIQISGLALLRLNGQRSASGYWDAIRELAAVGTIPIPDFLIVAKCGLEFVRCSLAANGQIQFDPSGWDAEDKEA